MNYTASVKKLISGELFYRKNKPKSLLFDHLPKCAGTTINSYLKNFYPYRLTYQIKSNSKEDFVRNFLAFDPDKQKKYKFIYGHRANQLIPFTDEDKIVATVLREPMDRIISNYYYIRRNVKHHLHQKVMKADVQLEDFCVANIGGEVNNWYVRHFSGLSKAEVMEHPEKAAAASINFIEKNYDLIGFQDDLPAFFSALEVKTGVFFSGLNDQHSKNTTNNRPIFEEVSDAVKQSISKHNRADILLYKELVGRKMNGVVLV